MNVGASEVGKKKKSEKQANALLQRWGTCLFHLLSFSKLVFSLFLAFAELQLITFHMKPR